MLNLISNIHLEAWVDVLKMKYFSKKFHDQRKDSSKRSRIQTIWENEMMNYTKGGIVEELTNLSQKYGLPNLNSIRVSDQEIN